MNKKDLADVFYVTLVGLACPFLLILDEFNPMSEHNEKRKEDAYT